MLSHRNREAIRFLNELTSGRHYGSSADSECWVMVGRELRDVAEWSIIPPSASLTLAWGAGGCSVEFAGGHLEARPGDWMWIDAGLAHRGVNLPGSDFLTVFFPERHVRAAALDTAPIGASVQRAHPILGNMLARIAVLLLKGKSTGAVEAPFLDAILDWVGTNFDALAADKAVTEPVARAAAMLREGQGDALRISEIAKAVGLSGSELSRRFQGHHRLTPEFYRKQVRLARATRSLAEGSSVLAAAHDAGFADTAHLSRTFRSQYGITPSRWAEQVLRVTRPCTLRD